MSGGKGGKPATQETVTNNAPWAGAVPYINQGLQEASSLYNAGGPQYYPGQTFAGTNSPLTNGINSLCDTGSMFGNATASDNPAYSYFNNVMKGDYLKEGNPYFGQVANTIKANVLPGINAQFANAGRGVSGLAARAASEGLGDAIGNLAYTNYNTERQNQSNAASSLSNIYDQTLKNRLNAGNASLLAGLTQQGQDQMAIDADKARWDYNQSLPYQNLQNYISNISAQTGKFGTSTDNRTSQQAQPSFFNQLLGTGLGIASFFV